MRGEEIRVAVGSRDGKTRQPEARLVCRVISRAANISDETEVIPWTKLTEMKDTKSDILREFLNSNYRHNVVGDWQKYWELAMKTNRNWPNSMCLPEFCLVYYLQVSLLLSYDS